MVPQLQNRVVSLITAYRPTDGARFRNDYRDAMQGTSEPESGLLVQARDCVEHFVQDPAPAFSDAWTRWKELHDGAIGHLPVPILAAVLRRFPTGSPDAPEWAGYILECRHTALVEALLASRAVTPRLLNAVARSHPALFLQSAALDVLITRNRLDEAKALWSAFGQTRTRPPGLLGYDRALLACYAALPTKDGGPLLATLLSAHPDLTPPVLTGMLHDLPGALRFCTYLLADTGKKRTEGQSIANRDLLTRWLLVCGNELQMASARALNASIIVASVRLRLFSTVGVAESVRGELGVTAASATAMVIADTLRRAEEGATQAPASMETVLCLFGSELGPVVHRHFRGVGDVPALTDDMSCATHIAGRHILKQVVQTMNDSQGEASLRDGLEVLLHNLGVRSTGAAGERVIFDSRFHETGAPGVVPGDEVLIVRPGRAVGEGERAFVLTKAAVRLP